MDDTFEVARDSGGAEGCSSSGEEESAAYLCPICLQPVAERCYTDPCFHLYCLACITEWTTRSTRCPLCNTAMQTLVHHDRHTQEPTKHRLPQGPTHAYAPRPSPYGRRPLFSGVSADLGVHKRRMVYAHNLRRVSSPATRRRRVSRDPAMLQRELRGEERCRRWVRRDLRVLLGVEDVGFFEQVVLADMQGGREAGGVLGEQVARRFVEELWAFVDAGLELEVYDRFVAYDTLGTALGEWGEEEAVGAVGEVVGERGQALGAAVAGEEGRGGG